MDQPQVSAPIRTTTVVTYRRPPRPKRRWFRSAGERTGPQRRRGDSR